jgi:hypothetical protein
LFNIAGLQELKVFVDLASISAGEGDMEVAKVKCLHAATTGYAPLIFNLDANCDSKMFLEKCELVWKELASDPKLPQKLVSTCQYTHTSTCTTKTGKYVSISVAKLEQNYYQLSN